MNRTLYLRKIRNLRDQVDMLLMESEQGQQPEPTAAEKKADEWFIGYVKNILFEGEAQTERKTIDPRTWGAYLDICKEKRQQFEALISRSSINQTQAQKLVKVLEKGTKITDIKLIVGNQQAMKTTGIVFIAIGLLLGVLFLAGEISKKFENIRKMFSPDASFMERVVAFLKSIVSAGVFIGFCIVPIGLGILLIMASNKEVITNEDNPAFEFITSLFNEVSSTLTGYAEIVNKNKE